MPETMTNPSDRNDNELQRLFLKALELKDVAAREAFLEKSCAGDLKLRKAVQAL
ncbi:MAG: hypothetical protein GWO24_05985, partial [Akkermansiaceae bacterium]|nr:hypothetical protein [Akkermansiaceae bacterium]